MRAQRARRKFLAQPSLAQKLPAQCARRCLSITKGLAVVIDARVARQAKIFEPQAVAGVQTLSLVCSLSHVERSLPVLLLRSVRAQRARRKFLADPDWRKNSLPSVLAVACRSSANLFCTRCARSAPSGNFWPSPGWRKNFPISVLAFAHRSRRVLLQ